METASAPGDTLFMRADLTEPAWCLLVPTPKAWAGHPAAGFPGYACGPESAERLLVRDGRNGLPPVFADS